MLATSAIAAEVAPGVGKRQAMGKEAGMGTPVLVHSGWRAAEDRPDPVALLEAQNLTRSRTWYRSATAG
jgi:voltage-gated potassium channel